MFFFYYVFKHKDKNNNIGLRQGKLTFGLACTCCDLNKVVNMSITNICLNKKTK